MRIKKETKYMLLLIVLLFISLGYAAISTQLKITGSALVKKQNWDVYWANPVVNPDSNTPDVIPSIVNDSGTTNTKLIWQASLRIPGDFYEFTVDAVNEGSIDAMITDLTPTISPALPPYIEYSITYDDGEDLEENHLLKKATTSGGVTTPTVEKIKVRVYYNEEKVDAATVNGITQEVTYSFTYDVDYGQATSDAIDRNANQGCPGKKCIYAFYNGDPKGVYDQYNPGYAVDIGDTLPLSFATTSTHSPTENYFGGPTYNYKELKLEYNEYMYTSTYSGKTYHNYYNSFNECKAWSNDCQFYRVASYQPKTFFGHILDDDGKVIQKFSCLDYHNNVYCFDSYKIYSNNRDAGYSAYNVFSIAFGEYDSTTGKGCKISNEDSLTNFKFTCIGDGTAKVDFNTNDANDTVKIEVWDGDTVIVLSNYVSGPSTIEEH